MFLGSPLPSFCEIFSTKEVNSKLYWENKPTLLMSESWGALQLLFKSYYQLFNKKNVIIYLPDYFCDSTVEAFRENWMTLCYYPVNKNFEPNWKFVEKMKELGFSSLPMLSIDNKILNFIHRNTIISF